MALIARGSNGDSGFTPVPQGMHLARCYRIVDLGTQKSEWQGTVKMLPKVMLQFEVHGEDDSGKPLLTGKGEPLSISKNFTLSLAEKATLRNDLANWRGRDFTSDELRGFELKNVMGHWAMISVSKEAGMNGKEYTNIKTINPVPASIKKAGLPEGVNKVGIFSIDEPDEDMLASFSDNLRLKIMASPEWQNKYGSKTPVKSTIEDMDDDIPF